MTEEQIARNVAVMTQMFPEFIKAYPRRANPLGIKIWANAIRSVIDMIEHDSLTDTPPFTKPEEIENYLVGLQVDGASSPQDGSQGK